MFILLIKTIPLTLTLTLSDSVAAVTNRLRRSSIIVFLGRGPGDRVVSPPVFHPWISYPSVINRSLVSPFFLNAGLKTLSVSDLVFGFIRI